MNSVHGIASNATPCPFCGQEILFVAHIIFWDMPSNYPYRVACPGCYTIGPRAATPELSIELWNRRPIKINSRVEQSGSSSGS